jgi:hypothetical protein
MEVTHPIYLFLILKYFPSPDILSDPAIKRIIWSDITVGSAIGKGASGLVTSGVWNPPGKKFVFFR